MFQVYVDGRPFGDCQHSESDAEALAEIVEENQPCALVTVRPAMEG